MIAIIPDNDKSFTEFSKAYLRILNFNKIQYKILDVDSPDFWDQLKKVDFLIYRWAHNDAGLQKATTILPVAEDSLKIHCFPDKNTWWSYDDKIKQYYWLKVYGFPVIETNIFWNREKALNLLKEIEFPVIFKLYRGAGAQNVIKLKSFKQARKITNHIFQKGYLSGRLPGHFKADIKEKGLPKTLKYLFKDLLLKLNFPGVKKNRWILNKNYAFFQEYCANNDYDTRVVTIGNRAFALQRSNRKNDFRASGSGLINYNPKDIDMDFIKIAFDVSKHFGFSTMAYDFLYDNNGEPVINEISYNFPHGDFLFKCPGYWDQELNWIPGNKLPQFFQLKDFLSDIELKCPPEYIST